MTGQAFTGDAPLSDRREHSLLMYRVATKHHVERLSNLEIARQLGISRFRVARLLEYAAQSGMVDIRVRFPLMIDHKLSEAVLTRYGLRDVRVLGNDGELSWRQHGVAALAIDRLGSLLPEGGSLGISWGRTMDTVAQTATRLIAHLPRVDIVQLVGGVPSSTGSLDASDLVRRFALLTGGRSILLNAPLVVPTRQVAEGLRRESSIAAVLRAGAATDVALFGIGAWESRQTGLREFLSDSDRAAAEVAGVGADICGTLLSRTGQELTIELTERIVNLEAAALRRIPRRVCVVLETTRVSGLRAGLQSGLITDLVLDRQSARSLLKEPRS